MEQQYHVSIKTREDGDTISRVIANHNISQNAIVSAMKVLTDLLHDLLHGTYDNDYRADHVYCIAELISNLALLDCNANVHDAVTMGGVTYVVNITKL